MPGVRKSAAQPGAWGAAHSFPPPPEETKKKEENNEINNFYATNAIQYTKSHESFSKNFRVTPRTPFWCCDPELGPLPSKILAARLVEICQLLILQSTKTILNLLAPLVLPIILLYSAHPPSLLLKYLIVHTTEPLLSSGIIYQNL